MAVVQPLSDVPRTKLTTRSTTAAKFAPAISQDFEMDLDMSLVKGIPERNTEPLIALDVRSTEVSDSLLSDAVDESSDIDTLEDVVERPRRGHGITTRQASGAQSENRCRRCGPRPGWTRRARWRRRYTDTDQP